MRQYISIRQTTSRWRVYHQSGHVDITSAGVQTWMYYVRDRLGSTRAVITEQGVPLQAMDYYPSGIPVETYNTNNTYAATNRLHTGKEFHAFDGLSWHDNAARRLDNILCRFTAIDPLAEKYPDISPYASRANSPLRFIDPDGMIQRDKDGNIRFWPLGFKGFGFKRDGDNEKSGSMALSQYGFIKTDKGRKVDVYNNNETLYSDIPQGRSIESNCFGLAFADGKYWIESNQIQKILDDDGYTEIGIEDAQVGDVVIYNDDNGNKVHAATISETDGSFDGTLVIGKGGDEKSPTENPITEGYNRPDKDGIVINTPISRIHIFRPRKRDNNTEK